MIEFKRHTLSNGLKVIAHFDSSTPMVTTDILYDVGSRDEDPEATGFAHLFEHLMFGGTTSIPVFDTPVMLAGGENNAFTNNDLTNYFITLPANNIETALFLEADRMTELDLSETRLRIQKSVVTEEFRQRYLNQPYGDLLLLLRPLTYKVHPYRWPAIGKDISHIEKADSKRVRQFYRNHYNPANAILCVAGNVLPDEVFKLSEKWFGKIPSGSRNSHSIPQEPLQEERREVTVYRKVPAAHLIMAFHTQGRDSRDFYILDLLTDILAGCDSGRFPGVIVREKKLFSEADIYLSGEIDPGLVIFSGRLKRGIDIKKAEEAVFEEFNKVISAPVSAAEIEKARNRYESMRLLSYLSAANKSFSLAFHELLGDADGINTEIERFMSVTSEEVSMCAARTFKHDNCSVIYYLPEEQ
jgi:predicted Zn-dependent peptidase